MPQAIESISVPLTEVASDMLFRIRRTLAEELIRILTSGAVGRPEDLAIRDMFPADFSGVATDGQFVNQVLGVADTYVSATDADVTLTDTQAFGVYGIVVHAAIPTLTEVRFQVGTAVTIAQFRIEPAFATPEAGVIFLPPVIYRPAEIFNMDFLFSGATAADSEVISVLGLVAEKAGTTISPRS